MEIEVFQKKLAEIVTFARYNNRKLDGEFVEKFFAEEGMEAAQMEKIYEYLRAQGIHILHNGEEDREDERRELSFQEQTGSEPLSEEEEDYLRGYMSTADSSEEITEEERILLFRRAKAEDSEAKQRLLEVYRPEVEKIVRQMHRKALFVEDMIQEGNIGILAAIAQLEDGDDIHEGILDGIRTAVHSMVREQEEQKWRDDCLVNRVEKLEAAVRNLTEEAGDKFSVEELSAFLDMSVEEIQDILKLTGEDK